LFSMNSPIVLIANPAAKRCSERKIRKAVELLGSSDREVILRLTERRGDAEEMARREAEKGSSLIVASGGDGTFNEVINGIANTETGMAILPMGTTNVLAKELGIPENVEGAVRVALRMKTHTVSLGRITLLSGSLPTDRHFCLMAGIGFDGDTVRSVSTALKKRSGKGAYIMGGFKTLMTYSPEPLTFTVNEEVCSGYFGIVGKASKYGGNFRVTPDARLENPDLYVCIMHGKKRMDLVRYALGILTSRHLGFKDVTYRRASYVRVEGNAFVQIDGDYIGRTPATITVAPNSLKLIY
jgi:diacylglycerol kinase (ATP)